MEQNENGATRAITEAAVPGEPQLGELLVREGLISRGQLDEALRVQRDLEHYKPLGRVLVDARLINPKQLDFVLDRFRKRVRLGEALVKAGALTEGRLQAALELQERSGLRLGEELLRAKAVTEHAMRQALCVQLGVPFVDLDGVTIDRSLARMINRRYAQTRRVVPVARLGDTLTVALDDPTVTGVVEELEASTGCPINVVTSTRAAFERAFARAYGDEPGAGRGNGGTGAVRPAPAPVAPAPRPEPRTPPMQPAASAAGAAASPAPGPVPTSGGRRPPPEVAQKILRDWEGFVRSIEALWRERDEARARWERLAHQHGELQAVHARLCREREAQAQALAELQAAHERLLREQAAAVLALRELRGLHAALLRERDLAADALELVLRRLKP